MLLLKIILGIFLALLAVMLLLGIIALLIKPNTVYKRKPSEKNRMEGKKVVFVPSENDPENADGVKGHLIAVGDSEKKHGFYAVFVKRLLDIIVSFGGLVVLSPVFLIISICIYAEDKGPVMFVQKRVGKNKRYFKLHKFRSMKMSTPHDVPTHMLGDADLYITKTGRFIRAHSLDEIPQIWDIFVGNMSIVGPRPALWNQDVLVAEREQYGANDVKPGLTGWAQINGRDELGIKEKAEKDGDYVQNMSFGFDCKCFFGSFHVFKKDDTIVEGGNAKKQDTETEQ